MLNFIILPEGFPLVDSISYAGSLPTYTKVCVTEMRKVFSKSNVAFLDDDATFESDLSKIPTEMYCSQIKTIINPSQNTEKRYKS